MAASAQPQAAVALSLEKEMAQSVCLASRTERSRAVGSARVIATRLTASFANSFSTLSLSGGSGTRDSVTSSACAKGSSSASASASPRPSGRASVRELSARVSPRLRLRSATETSLPRALASPPAAARPPRALASVLCLPSTAASGPHPTAALLCAETSLSSSWSHRTFAAERGAERPNGVESSASAATGSGCSVGNLILRCLLTVSSSSSRSCSCMK
mmetsp:Transcript_6299/g.13734  ORF Transcript_6299/g.13734 Transcript_6299/m.13734 type:complete len:218 (-) Transcript_6299:768-1421(-)